MNIRKHPIYPYLTVAGTLPFVIPAILLLMGMTTLPVLGGLTQLMSLYGLIIASFMAGSQWGLHINREDGWAIYLPLFSNVVALLVFFAFVITPTVIFAYLLLAAFVLMLLLDVELKVQGLINRNYLIWRVVATLLVVLSLIVLIIKS